MRAKELATLLNERDRRSASENRTRLQSEIARLASVDSSDVSDIEIDVLRQLVSAMGLTDRALLEGLNKFDEADRLRSTIRKLESEDGIGVETLRETAARDRDSKLEAYHASPMGTAKNAAHDVYRHAVDRFNNLDAAVASLKHYRQQLANLVAHHPELARQSSEMIGA